MNQYSNMNGLTSGNSQRDHRDTKESMDSTEDTQPKIPWWRNLLQWRALAILLIIVGLVIISLSMGYVHCVPIANFNISRAEGLDRGTARIDAIRPWMTVRYVGVAYARTRGIYLCPARDSL